MEISERVIALIAREQRLKPGRVLIDTTFAELGMDSLDGVNLLFAIEEEFKVDVPDLEARSMRTVRDVVEALAPLMSGSDAPGGAGKP